MEVDEVATVVLVSPEIEADFYLIAGLVFVEQIAPLLDALELDVLRESFLGCDDEFALGKAAGKGACIFDDLDFAFEFVGGRLCFHGRWEDGSGSVRREVEISVLSEK